MKRAVIVGASSGIGKGLAKLPTELSIILRSRHLDI